MDEDAQITEFSNYIAATGEEIADAIRAGHHDALFSGINSSDLNDDGKISPEEFPNLLSNYESTLSSNTVGFDIFPPSNLIELECDGALNDNSIDAQAYLAYSQGSFTAQHFLSEAIPAIADLDGEEKHSAVNRAATIRINLMVPDISAEEIENAYIRSEVAIIEASIERYESDPAFRDLIDNAPSLQELGSLSPPEFCNAALGRDVRDVEL